MKNKCMITMVMSAILLAATAVCGCGTKVEKTDVVEDAAAENDVATAGNEAVAEEAAATEKTANRELDVENLSEDQNRMLAIMDSLNMELYENSDTYNPADAEYAWRALYYTVGNYYGMEENPAYGQAEMSDSVLTVDESLVLQYAEGLFEGCSSLPDLPADCIVTVNAKDAGRYDFPIGDRGISYGAITSWTENADGTQTVVTELRAADTEEVMATGTYTLVDNPNAKNGEQTLFAFSVKEVQFTR